MTGCVTPWCTPWCPMPQCKGVLQTAASCPYFECHILGSLTCRSSDAIGSKGMQISKGTVRVAARCSSCSSRWRAARRRRPSGQRPTTRCRSCTASCSTSASKSSPCRTKRCRRQASLPNATQPPTLSLSEAVQCTWRQILIRLFTAVALLSPISTAEEGAGNLGAERGRESQHFCVERC